jgi:prolyl-tRNA synthetase
MRWTQTLIPTQKENPADAKIVSHQLMVRAGLIRQLTAGAYDFLPLALRSLQKAAAIVREEMNAIGCAEVLLPAIQPEELWQQSGRDAAYGPNLMRLKDRHGRSIVLGPTHEEVVTELVKGSVTSYRQLPLSLYQIQTKFRDEERPRFGLLRVREFLMKDAYSFHASRESLDHTYDQMYAAYSRIFTRCGIPFVVVEAESGPIGGSVSHEFMAACADGEDTILTSDKGNYVANVEKAETGTRPSTFGAEPTGALEKVHTPNLPSIEEVGKFMKVKPKNMLKSMLHVMTKTADDADPTKAKEPWYLLAIVRGDHDVNEAKLAAHAAGFVGEPVRVAMAPEGLAREDGWALGFVGPHAVTKRTDTFMLVDPDVAQGGFWAAGANEIDHHVKHFNWFRETGDILANPARVRIADIRNALAGDPSPKNDGGVLSASKGIEIGHVFKLGTKYSVAFDATVLDETGKNIPMIMGCYGIGIGRILIAAVESMHDEKGIIWPKPIAPYSVVITPIKYDGAVKAEADRIYQQLTAAGVDVLLDDRDARPGVKFADADLIGFPLRLTIGDRGLAEGKVELKLRSEPQPQMIALNEITAKIKELPV